MGKCPATVNVGDQQASRIAVQCHAHIHDVAGMQIDLGGGACTFDHHQVVFRDQFIQRFDNHRPHDRASVAPWHV